MKHALKVLHLIPSLTGGGAERQLSLLAPAMLDAGVEVDIGYVKPGVNLETLAGTSVRLHRVPCGSNHDPTVIVRLIQLIRSVKPDVVQTWLTQMDVLGGLSAHFMGVAHVLCERASADAYPGSWKNLLRRRVAARSSAIVANSQLGLEYWRQFAPRIPMRVIRNGVPAEAIRSARPAQLADLALPADGRLVMTAGRLVAQKNVLVLLEALEVLITHEPEVCAVIFGNGNLQGELERRIAASPASDRIRLRPYTQEIWSWMKRASLVVSASLFEGSPNIVMEAMIARCPLVVSDIKEHREILDDQMAFFCDARSATELARTMAIALRVNKATSEGVALAYQHAVHWTVQVAAQAYVELYREILRN